MKISVSNNEHQQALKQALQITGAKSLKHIYVVWFWSHIHDLDCNVLSRHWVYRNREERTKTFSRGHLVCPAPPPRWPQPDLFAFVHTFHQGLQQRQRDDRKTQELKQYIFLYSKSLECWITVCTDLPHLIFFLWVPQQQDQSIKQRMLFKGDAAVSVWKHKYRLGKGIWPGTWIIVDVHIQTSSNSTEISRLRLKNNLARIITIPKNIVYL